MGEADSYFNSSAQQQHQQPQQQDRSYGGPQYGQQQYGQPQYGGQQQYAQPSGPPPGPPPPTNYAPQGNGYGDGYGGRIDEKPQFEETFKIEKPKYNDVWAGILLILVFGGFVAVSAIALLGYTKTRNINGGGINDGRNTFALDTSTMILFGCVLAVAVVFSYAYVWLARIFPKQFIWVTGILNIVFAVGTAAFYFWRRYWSAAIVFTIFALFLMFAFYTWISRIPFSALMLKTSITVSKKYGHVYLVSFIGGLIAAAFGAWYSVTLVAVYTRWEPSPSCNTAGGGCSKGKVIGLIVFITFAMYWISEWLKNTIHVTISGVYGAWYFSPHNFPRGATRGAAKRALTYSFGSISFGSLIVAIIQFLRQLCSVARSEAAQEGGIGGMIGYVVFCILGCLISVLEWAAEFLNRYAFSHIALYGKAYIPAAKDTWHMIKDRGIDALVNECLIGPVLSFGGIFIGYACALLAYLFLYIQKPSYNTTGAYTPVVVAFAFLIGFQICNVFTTPLSSGIDTIFVAMGWDPQVLAREHPELYEEMARVYPKVHEVIQVR
ncbi:unnamed protein product [Clonostachys chloroleuca]|uniref:Protein PNS1 n=1 Tax=Clonostachys chloroleuca TaxID=1926264 RepID=A0AA35LZ09_9HYPO|nr:unnamed protein product [Clonostachys chloroleuca]